MAPNKKCGFCRDKIIYGDVHAFDRDFKCFICIECSQGIEAGCGILERHGVHHHSHVNLINTNLSRFAPPPS